MSKRRVLVTGASKGIGRAVADRLAAGGHERDRAGPDGAGGLSRPIPRGRPGRSGRDRGSTGRRSSAKAPVDGVVNNVGLARFGRIGSIDLDDLFSTYDMNVRTAVQVVQAVLPGMVEAKWGRIVNVTSLTTLGVAERTPYAAVEGRARNLHSYMGR